MLRVRSCQEGMTVIICSRLYMFDSCVHCTRLRDRIWEHPPLK